MISEVKSTVLYSLLTSVDVFCVRYIVIQDD